MSNNKRRWSWDTVVEPTEKALVPEDQFDVECEPTCFDYSDDGEALASCGFGTDEDYGFDGRGDDW